MRIAGVQMDVLLGEPERNLERLRERLRAAGDAGAELVIFPECSLTGYCFDSREEAWPFAEELGGPWQRTITEDCRQLGLYCVTGLLERDGTQLYNATVLVGPQGVLGSYRKVHLPFVGVDRFTDYGERPFAVQEIPGLRVGMNICYDAAFPEAARCLALLGADLIALPTNWPPGAECMSPSVIATRALENKIYYAAINRIGTERDVTFIGRSCICGPDGAIINSADPTEEKILLADLDVDQTREKRIIRRPNLHEIDRFADRRPEFYSPLLDPHTLTTPRQRLLPDA